MEIIHLHPFLLIVLVILLVLIRYGFKKMVSRIFKLIPIERTGVQLFTRGLILIFFNIAVLALFSLLKGGLFAGRLGAKSNPVAS